MKHPLEYVARKEAAWWVLVHGWRFITTVTRLHRATLSRHKHVVMVTGSYGKTTTTRAVRAVFGLPLDRWSELNANCFGEVGWTLLREPPWRRYGAVEVGIDVPGRMLHYARAIRPNTTIVTCIGNEHITAFGALERIREEKAEAVRILPKEGTAILNADDEHVRWMATQTDAHIVWFGLHASCDISASDIRLEWPHGSRLTLQVLGKSYSVRVRLIGHKLVYPLLAAAAAGIAAGRTSEQVIAALEQLPPTHGRLHPLPLPNGAYMLDDEYKGTRETVHVALDMLKQIPARRRIVVIGDLNNLPPPPEEPHYEAVGEHIARVADRVLIVGDRFSTYLPGLQRGGLGNGCILHAQGVHDAVQLLRSELGSGDVALVKGYEDQGLKRIILALQGHPVRCTVSWCTIREQFCDDCPLL
jgi:UDP-N-acetylmuramyl pentapeptide synthase